MMPVRGLVALGLVGLTVWSLMPPGRPAAATGWLPRVVSESSGLVRSGRDPSLFWTHNDSGALPYLYAVDGVGALRGTVRVQGASAVDWEDLARDDAGNLWIADMGNNDNTRRDLVVYRVPEPAPDAGAVKVTGAVAFRFPDQRGWPEPANLNFDAEALFWADGTLWVLTKHRSDQRTTLYRFPALDGEVVLERLGDVELGGDPARYGGMATGADLAGGELAVLTYHAIFLFPRPADGRSWLAGPARRIDLDQDVTDQCEGIAWDGDALVITNEGRAMFRLDEVDAAVGTRWP